MSSREDKPERRYPGLYENILPIIISILAVIVVVMIIFSVAVGTGILQF